MRLLLDTHTLLWWLDESPRLRADAARAIAEGEVAASAASVWEIAIKKAAGRLRAPDDLLDTLAGERFDLLPMTAPHALRAGELPPHHRDPFDRMLVAQAQLEGLTIVTRDPNIPRYGVPVLAA